ncbi:MAG: hypothetical protein IKN54_02230 [Lachnospiraceae bacterium]|nr:hypothetical protein [Lachnospiraceae bacterium]
MNDERFEIIYKKACDYEPTDYETAMIQKILDKPHADIIEAVTIAYLIGRHVPTSD